MLRLVTLLVVVGPLACDATMSSSGESRVDSANSGSGSSGSGSPGTPTMTNISCNASYTFTETSSALKIVTTTTYALVDVDPQSSYAIVQCGYRYNGALTGAVQTCPSGYACSTTGTPPQGSACLWNQSVTFVGASAEVVCQTQTVEYDGSGNELASTTYGYDSSLLAQW